MNRHDALHVQHADGLEAVGPDAAAARRGASSAPEILHVHNDEDPEHVGRDSAFGPHGTTSRSKPLPALHPDALEPAKRNPAVDHHSTAVPPSNPRKGLSPSMAALIAGVVVFLFCTGTIRIPRRIACGRILIPAQ